MNPLLEALEDHANAYEAVFQQAVEHCDYNSPEVVYSRIEACIDKWRDAPESEEFVEAMMATQRSLTPMFGMVAEFAWKRIAWWRRWRFDELAWCEAYSAGLFERGRRLGPL